MMMDHGPLISKYIWKNRIKKDVLKAVTVFLAITSLSGCSFTGTADKMPGIEDPAEKSLFAMDTYMTMTAYGDRAPEALDAAEKEIRRIEELISTGIETSEISRCNQEREADLSEDTSYLIRRSVELCKDTGGLFDITVYPLMKAWGFTDQNYRIPDDSELSDLLSTMGADEIRLDKRHVTLEKPGTELDLGGIAKGYTSGRVMDIFRDYGIEHAVISLGGNVQTLNDKPDGSCWKVAVEDPADTSDYIGVIQVKNKAVITSGSYERYFMKDGKIWHHIIDPRTGYPADSGLVSVTIVSEDGTLADGLSTALFIMGKEKAADYWRAHSDSFDMVLVEEDGTVSVSEGIDDKFSCERDWRTIQY